MKKLFLYVFLSFLMAASTSCGSDIDKKFTQGMTTGAISNLDLSIEEFNGKDVRGGALVRGTGAVPFDIKRVQVRPTLLGAVKTLKQKYPGCEWITVELAPGDAALSQYGLFAGRAVYKEGLLEVYNYIPSDKYMEEHNAAVGKPDPAIGGMVNDAPRLFRPDKDIFNKGRKIVAEFYQVKKQDNERCLNSKNPLSCYRTEDDIYRLVGKKLVYTQKEVKNLYRFMIYYYGIQPEEEKINLNG